MKKNELDRLEDCKGLFELSANLALEKRRNVSDTPKCMYTTSNTVDLLPLAFDSFIRQISRSYDNGTIEVYQQDGAWPIYHPINVVQRYRNYTILHEKNKKNSKQMEIILSPNEKYDNYEEWYDNTEDFDEEERSKISLKIISALDATSKNIKIISNILKEEKLLKSKQDDDEASDIDNSEIEESEEDEHLKGKNDKKKRKQKQKIPTSTKKTRKSSQK